MRERRGGVYGPYRHRRKWRVDVVSAGGERACRLYETEAEALAVIKATKQHLGYLSGVTVEDAIGRYELYLRDVKGNKPVSIDATVSRLNRMLGAAHAVQLRSLTADRCLQLYQGIVVDLAVDSHRNILAEVKTWARWCIREGWIRTSPAERIEGQGRRRRGKEQLRLDEARRWADKATQLAQDEPGAVAALCALMLGMRASEVVQRRVRDLDDGGRLLWIPFAKTKAGRRTLIIPDVLRPLLAGLAEGKQPDAWLFPSHRREWILDWVRRICRMAGVPVVSCHGLRGTFATLALDAGAEACEVARVLGHADERLTRQTYAAPGAGDDARGRAVMRVLSGGKSGGKQDGPEGGASEPSSNAAT